MSFLLFVDQLGTRAKWHEGGAPKATAHFRRLEKLVAASLDLTKPSTMQGGMIESDAAALMFTSLRETFAFGAHLFRAAFRVDKNRQRSSRTHPINYIWLRGAIVPCEADAPLRHETPLSSTVRSISVSRYSSSLLDAIAIEKSSFKGMRILVSESASLTREERRAEASFRHLDFPMTVSPFARLPDSMYPGRLAAGFFDFLWMTTDTSVAWQKLRRIADIRLHHSAGNVEEFMHAAATRVVFFAAKNKFTKEAARQNALLPGSSTSS
jgi:hypothetical protein